MPYRRLRQHLATRTDDWWPWLVVVFAVLLTAGCVTLVAAIGAAADQLSAGLGGTTRQAARADAVAGRMNEEVADGRFEFAVTGMRCGVRQVGTRRLGQKARGRFCLVTVTVKNIGRRARTLDAGAQTGYAADGRAFPSEAGAAMYAAGPGRTVLERIDPGVRVRGTLVFDVPRGTRLASVVLRGSALTRGVRIPLA
ncbi:DUF4352 domain-containing protein [Couchioplanes caeruleus]|uniref:DUF4352 domain-containing protein n=1 Tax=Couchioplanes caeruleus TaxID=56438 RepID=UPI0020BF7C8D|nr:DUF4352 domain-containing protein [Couchioplanes caeruleus]UQU65743.1 DUF4352 domain-containing protein [Couchioplanes caeruleus]